MQASERTTLLVSEGVHQGDDHRCHCARRKQLPLGRLHQPLCLTAAATTATVSAAFAAPTGLCPGEREQDGYLLAPAQLAHGVR